MYVCLYVYLKRNLTPPLPPPLSWEETMKIQRNFVYIYHALELVEWSTFSAKVFMVQKYFIIFCLEVLLFYNYLVIQLLISVLRWLVGDCVETWGEYSLI